MLEEPIQRSYISEFVNAGSSPARGSGSSPTHPPSGNRLEVLFGRLQRIAIGGDLAAWKKTLSEVQAAAQEGKVDLERDLEKRVLLKQLELTLFMQASKVARQRARFAEIKASDAQMEDKGDQAALLFQRAQKFNELADFLTQQLRTKTA